jgi:L-serine dehydratase
VKVLLYGSLAKTGKGHGTDVAVLLGLCGEDPVTFDVNEITSRIDQITEQKKLKLNGEREIDFDPAVDVVFLFDDSLPYHPNALTFLCSFDNGDEIAQTYYSIGGGFVVKEGEEDGDGTHVPLPYPIEKAEDLENACNKTGLNISGVVMVNENALRPEAETRAGVLRIWQTMRDCIYRGAHIGGELPGGLRIARQGRKGFLRLFCTITYYFFHHASPPSTSDNALSARDQA